MEHEITIEVRNRSTGRTAGALIKVPPDDLSRIIHTVKRLIRESEIRSRHARSRRRSGD